MKQLKNTKKLIIKNGRYRDLDFDKFPIIQDFQIIIEGRFKCFGNHLHYYSPRFGYLAGFPWWDHVDKDLKKMKREDIPCGTLDEIYNDIEQCWDIVIFKKRNYVYVLESSNEGSEIFETWFKVDKEIYFKEWEKILKQARELEE